MSSSNSLNIVLENRPASDLMLLCRYLENAIEDYESRVRLMTLQEHLAYETLQRLLRRNYGKVRPHFAATKRYKMIFTRGEACAFLAQFSACDHPSIAQIKIQISLNIKAPHHAQF
jgi:hypothetical protein